MAHPFVIYGDSPQLPSGLGRILRDLASRCVANEDLLGIRVATVGVSETTGLDWLSWPHFRFQPTWNDQGEQEVARAIAFLRDLGCTERPIVLTIFDPSRAFAVLNARNDDRIPRETHVWGYFPIDGHPVGETIGGPAGEMIRTVDRCLAYGRYGSHILSKTREEEISYLPHGLEVDAWRWTPPREGEDPVFWEWRNSLPEDTIVVGVVATNQPRKDHAIVFEVIRPLEDRLQCPVALWVHTDFLTRAWDFGELARIYGLAGRGRVFVSAARGDLAGAGEVLSDRMLARRYVGSSFTVAPGLGEGFGYPILESLLCGTPVVHVRYAGGAELLPLPAATVPYAWLRAEGIYGIQRPIIDADALLLTCATVVQEGLHLSPQIYRGAARWYAWEHVWPAWQQWMRDGIAQARSRNTHAAGLETT